MRAPPTGCTGRERSAQGAWTTPYRVAPTAEADEAAILVDMGFDPNRVHRRSRWDLVLVAAALLVCAALVVWAALG